MSKMYVKKNALSVMHYLAFSIERTLCHIRSQKRTEASLHHMCVLLIELHPKVAMYVGKLSSTNTTVSKRGHSQQYCQSFKQVCLCISLQANLA